MKKHQAWTLSTLALAALASGSLVVLNYLVDPLQFYRQARYQPNFSLQQRYQNPGLARNFPYDTIILGTSMTENFRPAYVNRKLGVRTLKLSISGSTAREQALIARVAIRTGKVKRVLWGLDYFSIRGEAHRVREDFGPFPYYLYDDNPWNDLSYLFNYSTSRDTLKVALLNLFKRKGSQDLELLNNWNADFKFGKAAVWSDWHAKMADPSYLKPEEYALSNLKANLDQNIISLARSHPNLRFDIFFPPASVLMHRFFLERSREVFLNEAAAKQYLFDQIGSLPNVRIYDFQTEKAITHNLESYKDMVHYGQEINDLIIDRIASESDQVTSNNLPSLLSRFNQDVQTIDISSLM